MMKLLFLISLITLFYTVVLSAPEANSTNDDDDYEGRHGHHGCLSDRAARKIVDRWTSLLEGQIDLLDRTVTDDISYEDESVNFLFNSTQPGPFIVGKQTFRRRLEVGVAQVGTTNLNFEPLLILHDCDTISFRWQATAQNTGLDPGS